MTKIKMTGQTIQRQKKKDRRTDKTKTKIKMTERQKKQRRKQKQQKSHLYFVIVLSVLLSFLFWSLYCLSFCHFYFGHCIVCPFVIFILVIVKNDRRTDNTMTK
jgi:Flp pilus assembly protein TadB